MSPARRRGRCAAVDEGSVRAGAVAVDPVEAVAAAVRFVHATGHRSSATLNSEVVVVEVQIDVALPLLSAAGYRPPASGAEFRPHRQRHLGSGSMAHGINMIRPRRLATLPRAFGASSPSSSSSSASASAGPYRGFASAGTLARRGAGAGGSSRRSGQHVLGQGLRAHRLGGMAPGGLGGHGRARRLGTRADRAAPPGRRFGPEPRRPPGRGRRAGDRVRGATAACRRRGRHALRRSCTSGGLGFHSGCSQGGLGSGGRWRDACGRQG